MKLNSDIMKRIEKFCAGYYKKNNVAHDLEHMYMTEKLAAYIARKEGYDIDICRAGSFFHDIMNGLRHSGHEKHALPLARRFLRKLKVDEDIIESICDCILCHSTFHIHRAKTKEAWAVHDADLLQLIGPYGYVKALSLRLVEKKMKMVDAVSSSEKKQNFCAPRMKTRIGRRIAKDNHKFMKEYYKRYKQFRSLKFK